MFGNLRAHVASAEARHMKIVLRSIHSTREQRPSAAMSRGVCRVCVLSGGPAVIALRTRLCARLRLTPDAVCAGDVHINVADASKTAPSVASNRLFRRHTGPQPVALVGFREWIFSENSGMQAYDKQLLSSSFSREHAAYNRGHDRALN